MDMENRCPSKKVLVNAITLDGANIVPLLLKVKNWQEKGAEVAFLGNQRFKNQVEEIGLFEPYNFIELKNTRSIKSKTHLVFEGLRRNILAFFYMKRLKGSFGTIYSLSSVLDQIIFPYFLKKFDKKIIWVAVFDNVVPFNEPGNRIMRLLAWIFFKISLSLLKKADKLFVISEDLSKFLIKKGFPPQSLILVSNGIENDLIEKAKSDTSKDIDGLFIGRINEAKGIYDMLEVLNIVKRQFSNFQLAIMGSGDKATFSNYKKRIQELKLEKNIQFLGYKTGQEKFNIIKSSKVFLFLSLRESFGISLLECVCSGIPCIAYDLKVFKDLYRNDEVFIFKKGDYEKIAQKIADIFKSGNFENKNGGLLLNKYSWEKRAETEYNFIE